MFCNRFSRAIVVVGCVLMVSACDTTDRFRYEQTLAKAKAGDVTAQGEVAQAMYDGCTPRCYWGKWAPPCDEQACSDWNHTAAENGDVGAQQRLAFLYAAGGACGINKDEAQSQVWYQRLAAYKN